jgi:phage terminase small subunit
MQRNGLKNAILKEIATGHATAQQCSELYKVPAATIRSWVHRANAKNGNVAKEKPVAQKKNVAVKGRVAKVRDVSPKCRTANVDENLKPDFVTITMDDVSTELTEKERLFCFRYLQNYNAPLAHVYAFDSTFASARSLAYTLMAKERIQKEISRLKKIKYSKLVYCPDAIIEKRMAIAFSDITDFVTFGTKDQPIYTRSGIVKNADGTPMLFPDNYIELKDHTKVDGGLISEISMGKHGPRIKLEDRDKALSWLDHFFEMNPEDKHRVEYETKRIEFEAQRLEIEKARLEVMRQQSGIGQTPGEGTVNDGFIAALGNLAGNAWQDYQDPEPLEDDVVAENEE